MVVLVVMVEVIEVMVVNVLMGVAVAVEVNMGVMVLEA